MLKMWESYRRGTEAHTTINAPLEDWQSWFLGKEKRMPAGRFYADVLTRAIEELQDKCLLPFCNYAKKRS